MNELTILLLYMFIIILGLGWILYRVAVYIRNEKDRESRWNEILVYDDQFKDYLKSLKKKDEAIKDEGSVKKNGIVDEAVPASGGAEQAKN